MNPFLLRLMVAFWFMATLALVANDAFVSGQSPSQAARFLPLLARNAPFISNPALRHYVGLAYVDRDVYGPEDSDIFLLRADGSQVRQLTDNNVGDTLPRWSPDGRLIAFLQREPDSQVSRPMLMNTDGSDLRPLSAIVRGEEMYLEWSPTGRELLLSIESPEQIWLIGVDGSESLISTTAVDGYAWQYWGWSPDGAYFHFRKPTGMWLYSLATQQSVRVSTDLYAQVFWHPTRPEILVNERFATPDHPYQQRGRLVRPDGSTIRELFMADLMQSEGWLEGGASFLLYRIEDSTKKLLYRLHLEGGEITPLTNSPVWFGGVSPHSDTLLYWEEGTGIWLHPLHGTPRLLTNPVCETYADECYLTNGAIWNEEESELLFTIHQSGVRWAEEGVWHLSLLEAEAPVTKVGSFYLGDGFLPFSTQYAPAHEFRAYPSPLSTIPLMVDSAAANVLRLDYIDALDVYVHEWRYLP